MRTKKKITKFVPIQSNPLVSAMQVQSNFIFTENGAKTNASTLSSILDFFGAAGAIRSRTEDDVIKLFSKAFSEDRLLATKILFYIRDIRNGQGEKKTFKTCIKWLAQNYPDVARKNLVNIGEYGRYDDLYSFVNTPLESEMFELISSQLQSDVQNMKDGKSVSLIGKWLKSENTSSKESCELGQKTRKALKMSSKQYRKMLSALRNHINVIETKMCSGDWKSINFERVPSKASMLYRKAFGKHDQERYAAYLKSVEKGEAKMNAGAIYPYEIMRSVIGGGSDAQAILQADLQWKSMPNWLEGNEHNGLVIADVSGSMMSNDGLPLLISVSLALYFSERNVGPFKDCWLNFSSTPMFQKFIGNNIFEKYHNMNKSNWSQSTNLQAAFDLILDSAIKNKVAQKDMVNVLYVVSDMEHNIACENNDKTNFELIREKFTNSGYELPRVVWWNVNARNDNFPIRADETGTALVSGASPSILKSLLSAKSFDPMSVVYETVNKARYDKVVV